MPSNPRIFAGLTMALLGWSLASAQAANITLPYSQAFSTSTSDLATTYPEFSENLGSFGGAASVDGGGILHFTSVDASDQSATVQPFPSPTNEIVIKAQITASLSDGNYNVGMVIGGNRLVFHPGYTGGAFRVEGIGGFGNTGMGYNPANNVFQQYEVHSFPGGLFTIKVTDGANPSNVFNASFTNVASYGGPIGFLRSGPNLGDGQYDNLIITQVPEPASCILLAVGAIGLLSLGRRRSVDD